jgi:tetratricopeptide (TPR) repeat protein
MELKLHDIHADSIELALDKARQYRSLLEPEIAESICLDILHIDPDNQPALVVYILALSDQLHHAGKKTQVQAIEMAIQKLRSRYQQFYYTGLLHERRARFMLTQSMARVFAYDYFIEALQFYQKAEKIRPDHNDESILRWNSCIRTIEKEKLKPRPDSKDVRLDMES